MTFPQREQERERETAERAGERFTLLSRVRPNRAGKALRAKKTKMEVSRTQGKAC